MPISKIPDSYVNNNAAWIPLRTVAKKVNELIDSIEGGSNSDLVVNSLTTVTTGTIGSNLTVTGHTLTNSLDVTNGVSAGGINAPIIVASNYLSLPKSYPIQTTSITTAVPITTVVGLLITVSSTLASNTSVTFNITNSNITSNSVLIVSASTATSGGIPVVGIQTVSTGIATIKLFNAGTTAFNGQIYISYILIP